MTILKKKVLVVDDEPLMREMLREVLASDTAEISCAASGEEALEYARAHDVDLVITDISMPHMQGTDLFFALKKMNPFLQVIVITGYPSLQNIVSMLEGGACDFIIKPFDLTLLRSVVDETFRRVDRWRMLRRELLERKGE